MTGTGMTIMTVIPADPVGAVVLAALAVAAASAAVAVVVAASAAAVLAAGAAVPAAAVLAGAGDTGGGLSPGNPNCTAKAPEYSGALAVRWQEPGG